MNLITIKDMLAWMDSGKPFSCEVVTYDRKRGKRTPHSQRREYPPAVLVQADPDSERDGRKLTEVEQMRKLLAQPHAGRNPNHYNWYTRNIRLLVNGHPTGQIKKIHPPLVITFNNKTVVP